MERLNYLDELIKLADRKEISYTKKQLEKMSEDRLEKIYERHREQELDSLNEAIVDTVIGKFDEFMKGVNMVSKKSKLGKKLQDKKLFRNDLKSFIGYFTPLFPYVGLLEGVVCTVNEIINNDDNTDSSNDSKSEPASGGEQNSDETEPDQNDPPQPSDDTKL